MSEESEKKQLEKLIEAMKTIQEMTRAEERASFIEKLEGLKAVYCDKLLTATDLIVKEWLKWSIKQLDNLIAELKEVG